MSKSGDGGQRNQDSPFSLEEILAEFGSGEQRPQREETPAGPAAPEEAVPSEEAGLPEEPPAEEAAPPFREERDWREDTIPFPMRPSGSVREKRTAERGMVTPFPGVPKRREPLKPPPGRGPARAEPPAEEDPSAERAQEERAVPGGPAPAETVETDDTKVLEFPTPQRPNPVAEGIDQLRQKADDFAGHMFEDAGSEMDKEVRRAEKLIPGVDVEAPAAPVRERKPRKLLPPAPDLSPAELTKRYAKGLKAFRLRTNLVLFLILPQVWLTVTRTMPAGLPAQTGLGQEALRCYAMAAVQGLALLLGLDVVLKGIVRLFQGRTGMDTLVVFANLFSLTDALLLPTLSQGEPTRVPFCAVGVLSLWSVMAGSLLKRRGQRLACRTAASASEPYLVTRDEGKWNGKDTYMKWSGPVSGFGSQIQGEDGAERIYRVVVPVLLVACFLFAVISSVGRERPEDILWCLAAIFSAAGSLSSTLCFGMPWRKLCHRLNKSGAALAGWQGLLGTTRSTNLVLTDIDLFPVGSATLNGIKVFGSFPIDKVVAVTATVIRDAGSGLEKIFYDLLRSQGTLYRSGSEFTAYEGGGASEIIRNELVLVGSASFMVLMDVSLPPGLKVKNAVFCAIDGELAGIFALNYHQPNTVPYAIDSLIRNRIVPVLATRDFNLVPSMLRQRCKLPVEKMEFPAVERRRELSDKDQDHSDTLTAVLCREGVGPFAEAVVGGRRLRSAVRLSAGLACIGSAVGALLAFYLTFVAGYDSLTPMNLLLFLLMWLVPTPLISGWVDRY